MTAFASGWAPRRPARRRSASWPSPSSSASSRSAGATTRSTPRATSPPDAATSRCPRGSSPPVPCGPRPSASCSRAPSRRSRSACGPGSSTSSRSPRAGLRPRPQTHAGEPAAVRGRLRAAARCGHAGRTPPPCRPPASCGRRGAAGHRGALREHRGGRRTGRGDRRPGDAPAYRPAGSLRASAVLVALAGLAPAHGRDPRRALALALLAAGTVLAVTGAVRGARMAERGRTRLPAHPGGRRPGDRGLPAQRVRRRPGLAAVGVASAA